ncbi:Beta-lactamase-like protein 2 [Sparganum proliferum]
MAAEQQRVGRPGDESVSGLQLKDVPLTTGSGTILCDVSTLFHRPYVPASMRRAVFQTLHGLSHPGIRASQQLLAERLKVKQRCQVLGPSMRWATQLWRSFINYMMLPKLPNVTQLNPLVTRILGQNAGLTTLQGTNSYLIGFPGYPRILIDTTSAGPRLPIYLNLLEAELRRNLSSKSQPPIAAVLLTHWHPDHSSAVDSVQILGAKSPGLEGSPRATVVSLKL